MPEFFSVLGLLVVMIAVFAAAYWASRWLAQKYQGGAACGHTRYMRVLERMAVSKDSALLLVQIGEKVYLISATAKQMSCVAELSQQDLPQIQQQQDGAMSQLNFLSVLQKTVQKGADSHGGEER